MSFQVESSKCRAGGREHRVAVLSHADGSVMAEVWPSFGCNCLRWRVHGLDLLYVSPDWQSNPVPTRTGIPVLFPFPNRIRDGRITWNGRDHKLPIQGPGGKHAIHGFACRKPWLVIGSEANERRAMLTAEF